MELTDAQYRHIERCLPTPRGNVTLDNRQVLNAILSVAEHGCKWRGLPKQFGNWHTVIDSYESVGEKRDARSRLCPVATPTDHPREGRSRGLGQYHHQSPSGWNGSVKKTGRKPWAGRAVNGPPRFIWLPQLLEQPERLPCPQARLTMPRRAASCCPASVNSRVRFPC